MVQLVIPFTRGGVPCLTPQQVETIIANADGSSSSAVFSYSIFDAYSASKACAKLGMSYAEFCGYKGADKYKTIMTIRQAWVGAHTPAPCTENAVVGEAEAGRVTIDMKALVKAVNEFKPSYCLPMYATSHSVEEVPNKKSRTAAVRTARWYEAATQQGALKPIVAVPSSLVASTGASSDSMAQSPLVFLDSAGHGESLGARIGAAAKMVEANSPNDLTTSSSTDAAEDNAAASKKTTFIVAESIPAILLAALVGVDLVECEYGFACARRGQSLDLTPLIAAVKGDDVTTSAKLTFLYDLNDQKYQLDTVPFAAGCTCYSCKRHTRAYVYHLLSVQEMNTETLLTIHNLSQIVELCAALKAQAAEVTPFVFQQRVNKALALLTPA